MKRRKVLTVTLSVGIVILIFIGFYSLPNLQERAASASGGPQLKTAPDFELKGLDGHSAKLSDFRGKIVVLNFWATWCAPCRVEMPALIALYDKYRSHGVEVIGVSMDDGAQERVASFVSEMKVDYRILLGSQSVADSYGGLRLLPQTLFITPDGRIFQTTIGMGEKKNLEAAVEELLATQPRN